MGLQGCLIGGRIDRRGCEMKRIVGVMFIALTTAIMAGGLSAQAEEKAYGWQLMSQQERTEYRQKMRTMNAEERAAYRKEHHEKMQERAKERGMKLPDEPGTGMGRQGKGMGMERGQGMGQGMGQGRGMGQGKGMGKGMGR